MMTIQDIYICIKQYVVTLLRAQLCAEGRWCRELFFNWECDVSAVGEVWRGCNRILPDVNAS